MKQLIDIACWGIGIAALALLFSACFASNL